MNLDDDREYQARVNAAKAARVDKPKDVHPWSPPYDPDTPCPELRCAVTGRVDAADDCTCAGCTAAKVRGR